MLKAIYEGNLSALFHMGEVAEEGTLVALDPDKPGFVKIAGDDDVFGILAEKVKDYTGEDFGGYHSPVKPIAGVGGKAGVYHDGGTYVTTVFVDGDYAPGDKLYSSAGKLTADGGGGEEGAEGQVVGTVIKFEGDKLTFELAV